MFLLTTKKWERKEKRKKKKENRPIDRKLSWSVLLEMTIKIDLAILIRTCSRLKLVWPKNRLQPTVDHS